MDVNKFQIGDQYGFQVECTPMDELRVIIPTRLVGTTFGGNVIDYNFWTSAATNSATITQLNGEVSLSTLTNSAATSQLTTNRTARYVSGSANRYRSQMYMSDTGYTGNIKQWGIDGNGTDGAYFQLSGTTLQIVSMCAGTATTVASTSWNNNTTLPTLTNCTSYEIYYNNGKVYFVIAGILKHTVNATSLPWTSYMNLKCFMKNYNIGNTTSTTLKCRVASISRLGQIETLPTSYFTKATESGRVLKYSAGNLHFVINQDNVGKCLLYDALSATNQIAEIDCTKVVGSLDFHIPFGTGLYMVTTGNAIVSIVYE